MTGRSPDSPRSGANSCLMQYQLRNKPGICHAYNSLKSNIMIRVKFGIQTAIRADTNTSKRARTARLLIINKPPKNQNVR